MIFYVIEFMVGKLIWFIF